MTSRERVLTALARRPTDRVPRDFWIEQPALRRLQAHLGLDDEEAVRRRLRIDVRHLHPVYPADTRLRPVSRGCASSGPVARGRACPHARESLSVWQNYWGERFIWKQTPWGPMREDLPGALSEAASLEDLAAFAWPTPDRFDYSDLAEAAQRHDDYAQLYGFADVWQRPALVRGWEHMFLDMAARPEWAHFLCRKFTDFYKEDYTRAAEATGGRIDLYLLLSDLGSQAGPLISLPMFRDLVAPYLREMVDHIHSLGARVLYHSCGAIARFIPSGSSSYLTSTALTLMPHGSVRSSMICCSSMLILSLAERTSSSSALPTTERSVV